MKKLWVRLSVATSGVIVVFMVLQILLLWAFPPIDRLGLAPRMPLGRGIVLGVGIIGAVAGVVVSRSISAPITRMVQAAHRIGGGELSHRVDVGGSEEIVELSEAFNRMAEDLEKAELQRRNLMADVSHELRTPLTVLEGNLRAVLDQVYVLDEAEVADLYSQTRHLIRLVDDLHELSLAEARRLPLEIVEQDVTPMVRETVAVFEPLAASAGVSLQVRQPEHLPLVPVDGMRIRQVLHNLLANALRHTPAGGTIRLSVGGTIDSLRISVVDTGKGIAPEHLSHVFDRFYRADQSRSRQTGGTGLGLAIVRAIVEGHGGTVEARSDGIGQGSAFDVSLPLVTERHVNPGSARATVA